MNSYNDSGIQLSLTGYQETSREAFYSLEDLGGKQLRVYESLKEGYLNNTMVAKLLGWSINRVTPRMNELAKAGFVEEKMRIPCLITGRTSIYWGIKK